MAALRVLVVGLGGMGRSHARVYHDMDRVEIVGLCSRHASTLDDLPAGWAGYRRFDDYDTALAVTRPEAVCLCTWPDTHAAYTLKALAAGAHVFLEKPLAATVQEAEAVVAAAAGSGRKLVVGYILRHHPSWQRFVELARELGKPLVMRLSLNQQSSGAQWQVHRHLMDSLSPIVDCGVHYVDMMCLMTRAQPVRVQAIGARLCDDLPAGMYNYGQLQVVFDDGSIGWYEAGWGPMMSETAYFVKDVIGPEGCVSMVAAEQAGAGVASADLAAHTRTQALRRHHAALSPAGEFIQEDIVLSMANEPNHDDLCRQEQEYFLQAIAEDLDLSDHLRDALNSLRIVLAADRSVRTGRSVDLRAP